MRKNNNKKTININATMRNLELSFSTKDFKVFEKAASRALLYDYDLLSYINSKYSKSIISETFHKINKKSMLPNTILELTTNIDEDIERKRKEKEKKEGREDTKHNYEKQLQQSLYLSIIVLLEYKTTIENFITLERQLFKHIFLGDYSDCIDVLNSIESTICISQWSLHMRMTIYHLADMREELNDLVNKIDSEYKHFHGKISAHLHLTKLNSMNSDAIFTDTLLYEFRYSRDKWKNDLKKSEEKEDVWKYKNFNSHYYEKSVIAPFNKKSSYENLFDVLKLNSYASIIDLYKTYVSVVVELQIDEDGYFQDYIATKYNTIISNTIKLSKNVNIIKVDNIKNEDITNEYFKQQPNKQNLFEIYNQFLLGEFKIVYDQCMELLEDYPYSIDIIYYLLHSVAFSKRLKINTVLEKFKKNSILYVVIYNYYNLLTGVEVISSVENLKKLLLYFGYQSQWNMYLYHLISQYLCLNSDTRTKNFTNSIKYSYFNNPRMFYNFNKEAQLKVLERLKTEYPSISVVFNSSLEKSQLLHRHVIPMFRGDYILSLNNPNDATTFSIIKFLYDNLDDKPFFYRLRITRLYVNLLINASEYVEAIEIIISMVIQQDIPLCMFKYKDNENNFLLKNIENMPHYPLLKILDNPSDTVGVYYAMQEYLCSIDRDCKLVSHMNDYINKYRVNDYINKYREVELTLLNYINYEHYIAEFMPYLNSREFVIKEQIKILDILKNNDSQKSFERLEKLLNKKLLIIKNRIHSDENRIILFLDEAKENVWNLFEAYFKEYESAEWGDELYVYYERNKEAGTIYTNKNFWKEEKLENLFRLIIEGNDGIVFSNTGISNSINENVIHNHFDNMCIQTLWRNNLYIKEGDKRILHNTTLDDVIKRYSRTVDDLLSEYKNNMKIEDIDSSSYFFNLNYDSLITKEIFIDFIEENKRFKFDISSEEFFKQIIDIVIDRIKEKLKEGREKLIDSFSQDMDKLIDEHLHEFEAIRNESLSAKDELHTKTYSSIENWFTLNDNYIYTTPFTIKDITDTLQDEYEELNNVSIKIKDDKVFHGEYFHNMWKIYFVILDNIFKYAKSEKKVITISVEDSDNKIKISNLNDVDKNHTHSEEGTGLTYISKNLKLMHPDNDIEILPVSEHNPKYTIVLQINKGVLSE